MIDMMNLADIYGTQRMGTGAQLAGMSQINGGATGSTNAGQQGVYYGNPAPIGFGYSYTPPIGAYGVYPGNLQGFPQAAGYIGQGSQQAADYLQRGYENSFNMKADALAGGMNERNRRLAAEIGAQGLSPEMLRRQRFVLDAQDRARLGALYGESQMGLNMDLAKLAKGTGTELAGLKEDELSTLLGEGNAAKARKAARKAGRRGLLGSLVGATGNFITGGGLGELGSLFGGGGSGEPLPNLYDELGYSYSGV